MQMQKWFIAIALLLSGAAYAQTTPPTAGGGCTPGANTYCVTSTADTDGNVCDNSTPTSLCTLRQAINAANAAGGAKTIGFDIPSPNPSSPVSQTITLASQLPAINPNGTLTSLLIDGTSQPGSVLNTNTPDQGGLNTKLMIEIAGASGTYGFLYNCCALPLISITLQGLDLHGFGGVIDGQTATLTPKAQWNIYGSFVGTTIDGTAKATGSAQQGIRIDYDSAQIGGTQAWQRNLISGNSYCGVDEASPNSTLIVEGNLIGTDVTGTKPIPNDVGVLIGGNLQGVRIGCTGTGCASTASRNVISGNGLSIKEEDTYGIGNGGAQIKGNYIGTDWTGNKPLPNGPTSGTCAYYCGGILTLSGYSRGPALIVGGFNPGEANLIAFNNGPGIWSNPLVATSGLSASFDNHGNAVHNNAGIDVGFQYGWIPNDPGDADTGVNNLQNYPVIQSASVTGNQLTVTYLVDSTTGNSTYPLRIDFYVDIDEGSGEFLVSDQYTTPQTLKTVTLTLPANALPLTGFVASATDTNGYSSEFSPSWVFDRIFADRFEGH